MTEPSLVTMTEYEALLQERPRKFTPEQVAFREADGVEMCAACTHWYRSAGGEHDVCEIMRPPDEQVPWDWTCDFFNVDREKYPLYQGGDE